MQYTQQNINILCPLYWYGYRRIVARATGVYTIYYGCISGNRRGRAAGVLWVCCGRTTGVLRAYYGCAAGVLRVCCGRTTGVLREYYGCAVGVLRVCCGHTAGTQAILWSIQLYSQKVNLTIDGGMASQTLVLHNQTPSCLHFCAAQ